MLEKKIAKQIDKKKGEMQEEEVRYSIEIIKNELSDLPIYKLDQKFTEEQMNKRRKTQHYRLKALLKIKIILEKSIIWTFAISIIICSYAFYRDYETKQIISINKETVQIGSVGEQGEKEQMDCNEITQPFSENNVSGESKDEKAVDQTEDAFRNLWNKYMGELETREIVNMDEALAIAKESCICWGENVDDELEWAYSDIETYGFSVFGKVKTQEEDISRRTNVNAKIFLDLGRGYSEAVDEFLKSENTSYFTYRVVGVACLRGTDIYMSAVRHNITNHETKAECYKKTALLLREYADSVYENQKKNELDANIIDDWSKKEFILYIFSAVCYEEAEKLGDRSSAEEAIKMKLSENDNWKAFAS